MKISNLLIKRNPKILRKMIIDYFIKKYNNDLDLINNIISSFKYDILGFIKASAFILTSNGNVDFIVTTKELKKMNYYIIGLINNFDEKEIMKQLTIMDSEIKAIKFVDLNYRFEIEKNN